MALFGSGLLFSFALSLTGCQSPSGGNISQARQKIDDMLNDEMLHTPPVKDKESDNWHNSQPNKKEFYKDSPPLHSDAFPRQGPDFGFHGPVNPSELLKEFFADSPLGNTPFEMQSNGQDEFGFFNFNSNPLQAFSAQTQAITVQEKPSHFEILIPLLNEDDANAVKVTVKPHRIQISGVLKQRGNNDALFSSTFMRSLTTQSTLDPEGVEQRIEQRSETEYSEKQLKIIIPKLATKVDPDHSIGQLKSNSGNGDTLQKPFEQKTLRNALKGITRREI